MYQKKKRLKKDQEAMNKMADLWADSCVRLWGMMEKYNREDLMDKATIWDALILLQSDRLYEPGQAGRKSKGVS